MRMTEGMADTLGPVRDVHVAALLEALAEGLGRGAEVDAEPVDRDVDGRLRRTSPLNLPSRHDLRVVERGRTLYQRAPGGCELCFAPFWATLDDGARARIGPFNWGGATVRLGPAPGAPNWMPLRLWYLEWFQARFGEESPDLLGVVHRLGGPWPEGAGWRFEIDLGSASVSGFGAMLDALALTGAAEIAIGEPAGAL